MVDTTTPSLRLSDQQIEDIPLWKAVVPILVLIVLLVVNVAIYRADAGYGPNQLALIAAAVVAGIVGKSMNISVAQVMEGVTASIHAAMGAILILLMIGAIAGTWMISGIVPAMIYYGLQLLHPAVFLFAAAIICSIVSVATGSSWATIATVGVALLGIGNAMGFHDGMTAGAIISGAYFGDKLSPLSDTTNLASAITRTDLIVHIRYMLWTTVPSIVIALLIFAAIGVVHQPETATRKTMELSLAMTEKFRLNPMLFLVPIGTLVMVAMRVDAALSLFFGALAGGVFAVIFQPEVINEVGQGPNYLNRSYTAVVNAMTMETTIASDNPRAVRLLTSNGMAGMLNTVWLIMSAMCFGGAMEACGLLRRITLPLVRAARSTASLVTTTVGTCLFFNVTASDQYLAIIVPGGMYREAFQDRGLAPQNLSRTLEDSATVTSVLVPWNTCGAAQAVALGVPTLTYLPFCFFNLISPVMTILVAAAGWQIAKIAFVDDAGGPVEQASYDGQEAPR